MTISFQDVEEYEQLPVRHNEDAINTYVKISYNIIQLVSGLAIVITAILNITLETSPRIIARLMYNDKQTSLPLSPPVQCCGGSEDLRKATSVKIRL